MYLAVRTDKPEAEIYLLNTDGTVAAQKIWDADRTLARDLPGEIDELVGENYEQLTGVVAFRGPGSFTGLRIGINVANTISYARNLPIVGVNGDDWLSAGVKRLQDSGNDKIVLPEYNAEPNITAPSK